MKMGLTQILGLVGALKDSGGEDSARERFRGFLRENVREVGQVRDYIQECLRQSGPQYSRALQDLVNHLGTFLGFEVTFGRYQGVSAEVGFDGHWTSPKDFHIVVEVKTTETYAIKIARLLGYVNELVSERAIPSAKDAMGMYVVGRLEEEVRQLHNAIVAEKHTEELRVASVESLLSLAELMSEYDVEHDEVLSILRPSGPDVDPIVELIARVVAQPSPKEEEPGREPAPPLAAPGKPKREPLYLLTPVKSHEGETAEECIQNLVGRESVYAFGDRTPYRKHLSPGDWLCFYATQNGVVAHARVASTPKRQTHAAVVNQERYPWTFKVDHAELYLDQPVVIDAELRSQLEAFEGKDPSGAWAWLVQSTQKLTKHDFELLIRQPR